MPKVAEAKLVVIDMEVGDLVQVRCVGKGGKIRTGLINCLSTKDGSGAWLLADGILGDSGSNANGTAAPAAAAPAAATRV